MNGRECSLFTPAESLTDGLQKAIHEEYVLGTEETRHMITYYLSRLAASDEKWYVPVDFGGDEDEVICDSSEKIQHCPGIKKRSIVVLHAEDSTEEIMLCAFTSNDDVESGELPVSTLTYGFRQLIEDFVSSEKYDNLRINPWGEYVDLPRELAKTLISKREKPIFPILHPQAVIDTNIILDDWNLQWNEDGKIEDWRLIAYPIMADGTVALVFQMQEEIYEKENHQIKVAHTVSHFRVMLYNIDGLPKLVDKYRFKFQDTDLFTVYVHAEKLFTVVKKQGDNEFYVFQVFPNDDNTQFEIGTYANRAVCLPDGKIAVGYDHNDFDPRSMPVFLFDSDGTRIGGIYNSDVMICNDISLDSNDKLWFHVFPSKYINKWDVDEEHYEPYLVELSGFDSFSFNEDNSAIIVSYCNDDDECSVFLMKNDGKNGFINPDRLLIDLPLDREKHYPGDFEKYGQPSCMKSKMIFNADGRLYIFNLNDPMNRLLWEE